MQKPALLLHNKLFAVLDVNALGQVAHVHAAALEVIDAVVGSEAVGGGDSLHASDNGLIGFLARVDIDAVAFGVVVVFKERARGPSGALCGSSRM